MPYESGCNAFGGGPLMEVHWKRLGWNVKHLLDFKNGNPHHVKHRKAYSDLFHAMVNISVEFCRACPYRAGHFMFYSNVAWIALGIATACGYVYFHNPF